MSPLCPTVQHVHSTATKTAAQSALGAYMEAQARAHAGLRDANSPESTEHRDTRPGLGRDVRQGNAMSWAKIEHPTSNWQFEACPAHSRRTCQNRLAVRVQSRRLARTRQASLSGIQAVWNPNRLGVINRTRPCLAHLTFGPGTRHVAEPTCAPTSRYHPTD